MGSFTSIFAGIYFFVFVILTSIMVYNKYMHYQRFKFNEKMMAEAAKIQLRANAIKPDSQSWKDQDIRAVFAKRQTVRSVQIEPEPESHYDVSGSIIDISTVIDVKHINDSSIVLTSHNQGYFIVSREKKTKKIEERWKRTDPEKWNDCTYFPPSVDDSGLLVVMPVASNTHNVGKVIVMDNGEFTEIVEDNSTIHKPFNTAIDSTRRAILVAYIRQDTNTGYIVEYAQDSNGSWTRSLTLNSESFFYGRSMNVTRNQLVVSSATHVEFYGRLSSIDCLWTLTNIFETSSEGGFGMSIASSSLSLSGTLTAVTDPVLRSIILYRFDRLAIHVSNIDIQDSSDHVSEASAGHKIQFVNDRMIIYSDTKFIYYVDLMSKANSVRRFKISDNDENENGNEILECGLVNFSVSPNQKELVVIAPNKRLNTFDLISLFQ